MGQCCFWTRPVAKIPVCEVRDFAPCQISAWGCFGPSVRSSRALCWVYSQLCCLPLLLATAQPRQLRLRLRCRTLPCARDLPAEEQRREGIRWEFIFSLLPLPSRSRLAQAALQKHLGAVVSLSEGTEPRRESGSAAVPARDGARRGERAPLHCHEISHV